MGEAVWCDYRCPDPRSQSRVGTRRVTLRTRCCCLGIVNVSNFVQLPESPKTSRRHLIIFLTDFGNDTDTDETLTAWVYSRIAHPKSRLFSDCRMRMIVNGASLRRVRDSHYTLMVKGRAVGVISQIKWRASDLRISLCNVRPPVLDVLFFLCLNYGATTDSKQRSS